jgi:hypothetical protein
MPGRKKTVYKHPQPVVKKSLKQRAIEFARDNKVPLQVGMSFLASTAGSAYLVSRHNKKKRGYEEAQKKAKAAVENYRNNNANESAQLLLPPPPIYNKPEINNLQTGNKSIKHDVNNLAKGFSETAEQIRKNREKREAEKAERRRLEEEEIGRQRLEQEIQSHPLDKKKLFDPNEEKIDIENRLKEYGPFRALTPQEAQIKKDLQERLNRLQTKFGKRRLTLKTLEKDIKVLKRLKF